MLELSEGTGMTLNELKMLAHDIANNLREWADEDFELTSDDFDNADELELIEQQLRGAAFAFGMVP